MRSLLTLLLIASRSLRQHALSTVVTACSTALAAGLVQGSAGVGGPLAVGFCCAGGAQDAVLLLEASVSLLDRKALDVVEPDLPPIAGALGALQILGLLALDSDWQANNRFIYNGFGCTTPMAASIGAALGVCIACKRCC